MWDGGATVARPYSDYALPRELGTWREPKHGYRVAANILLNDESAYFDVLKIVRLQLDDHSVVGISSLRSQSVQIDK